MFLEYFLVSLTILQEHGEKYSVLKKNKKKQYQYDHHTLSDIITIYKNKAEKSIKSFQKWKTFEFQNSWEVETIGHKLSKLNL